MHTVIVIPAYNEEHRIANVLRAAQSYGERVIAVDDGSRDRTWEIIRSMRGNIIPLRHRINLGKGAALRTGCEAAKRIGARIIVTIDGDGQHPADRIPSVIEPIRNGSCAAVFTKREQGGDHMPFVRRLGNRCLNFTTRYAFGVQLEDIWCGFRAFTIATYERAKWSTPDYAGEIEMVLKIGRARIPYCEVSIPTVYHDAAKGVDILHGTKLLARILCWRLGLL